ncbi:hypothetical protein ACJRO7_026476 [Eucalyptus globulus]|uniref:Uncharacterized protein n=1 Tax=Eucalyptus globulus TaxID=34317 RepID=A0ABD3JVC7_EUCGL
MCRLVKIYLCDTFILQQYSLWLHTRVAPSPLQERFGSMKALDNKTEIESLLYEVPKIRLLRNLIIQGSKGLQYSMQVLHFAVFPEPEYDLPIFCANFFIAAETIIVVLDLNLLYDVVKHKEYKDKCYEGLMSLGLKYADFLDFFLSFLDVSAEHHFMPLLPWGGNLTGESLRFFTNSHMDQAWLVLMDLGIRETDASQIIANLEAQHWYLTSRAEKVNHLVTHLLPYLHLQPTCEVYLLHAHAETSATTNVPDLGYEVLKRLFGETHAKIEIFLFDGVDSLGCKTFLDYFPEYPCEEGRVNEKHAREVFCNSPVEQERRIYRKL